MKIIGISVLLTLLTVNIWLSMIIDRAREQRDRKED